jgi:hypothetical protein
MNAKERAEHLVTEVGAGMGRDVRWMQDFIELAIRDAEQAQRERDAQIVDDYDDGGARGMLVEQIVKAIREQEANG